MPKLDNFFLYTLYIIELLVKRQIISDEMKKTKMKQVTKLHTKLGTTI